MPFLGKLVGGALGFTLGGPVGAAIGFVIGHLKDSGGFKTEHLIIEKTHKQGQDGVSFFRNGENLFDGSVSPIHAVIVLGAKMAKVDGRVSAAEIIAFRRAFNLPETLDEQVGILFNRARASAEGYQPYALRLAQIYAFDRQELEAILKGLFSIALADGRGLTTDKINYLAQVCMLMGLYEEDFITVGARAGVRLTRGWASGRDEGNQSRGHNQYQRNYDGYRDPWAVLGLPSDADVTTIKRTYRTLVRQHHPDRLTASGASAAQIASATERLKTLNVAYAEICRIKGIV